MSKKFIIAVLFSAFAVFPLSETFAMEKLDSENGECLLEGSDAKKEECVDSKKADKPKHKKHKKKGKKHHKNGGKRTAKKITPAAADAAEDATPIA